MLKTPLETTACVSDRALRPCAGALGAASPSRPSQPPVGAGGARPGGLFRLWLLALLVGLSPALTGCAAFRPLDGVPARHLPNLMLDTPRSNRQTIDLSLLRQTPPPEHLIDTHDVLGVYIEGVLGRSEDAPPVHFPGMEGHEGARPSVGYPIPVREDGTIALPLIEPLFVRGMTIAQVEHCIRRAYTVDNPILKAGVNRIMINLQKPRTYRILVIRQEAGNTAVPDYTAQRDPYALKRGSGQVVKLPAYRNDVLNALAETGGLPGVDAENVIHIIRRAGHAPAVPAFRPALQAPPPAGAPAPPAELPTAPEATPASTATGGTIQQAAFFQPTRPPAAADPSQIQQLGLSPGHLPPRRFNPTYAPPAADPYAGGAVHAAWQSHLHGAGGVVQATQAGPPHAPPSAHPYAPPGAQHAGYGYPAPVPYAAPPGHPPAPFAAPPQAYGPPSPHGYLPAGVPYAAGPAAQDFWGHWPVDPSLLDPTVGNPNVVKIPLRLAPGERPMISERDIILHEGDIVFIESRDEEVYYTGGLLGGGQYVLPRDYDLDVLGALAIAQAKNNNNHTIIRSIGGVAALNQDVTVGASDVVILRRLPSGQQVSIKVDLYKAVRRPEERVLIQPGDYIVLQYTPAEAMAAFFERHIFEGAFFGIAGAIINRN